ncbi:MAG TPA: lysylphosphatidylglycerol synthase domain-containing protein [Longimicrobium sp.]|uniref:lysylphosphatidylglycerol synthase domain-containing protein n=1 Tax=Longimicrobium sp. TaxID=2029185 RepID=UPI002EDBB6C8
MKRSTLLKRAAGLLLVAATVWYLADTIGAHWGELRAFDWRPDPVLLAASVVAHVLVLSWGVWVWGRVLRHFEHPPVRLGMLQRIWFLSNLARYVPGKVFQFIAVAQLSRGAGLSGPVLITSMLVATGMSLLSAVVVAAWTLAGQMVPGVDPLWVGIVATTGAALAVHPGFLNRLIALIPRLLGKDVIRWNAGWGDGLVLLGLSVVSWGFYGVAYHLFVASLADVPWRLLPQMAGVNALSFFIGYASPLPGGAGLREISMTGLLTPHFSGGVAAVLSIAVRLWTIAAELIGGSAAALLVRGGPGVDGPSSADPAGAVPVPQQP